jgi:hypothetical protein
MCEYRKGREKDRQTKMKGSVIQGKGVEETGFWVPSRVLAHLAGWDRAHGSVSSAA